MRVSDDDLAREIRHGYPWTKAHKIARELLAARRVVEASREAEISMDTMATIIHRSDFPPAYAEAWANRHTAMADALAEYDRVTHDQD